MKGRISMAIDNLKNTIIQFNGMIQKSKKQANNIAGVNTKKKDGQVDGAGVPVPKDSHTQTTLPIEKTHGSHGGNIKKGEEDEGAEGKIVSSSETGVPKSNFCSGGDEQLQGDTKENQ